ncbi:phosphoribosylamine--glycine ligase [Croceivirga thetidis]|uniref:Phosphoribosylamine--glycine ligase n=1 Tax=Croceivirga thetidis TaxID=2721623 RepID=A0ABX1GNP6_9FLAO|nr:phosphoribosylamine--glycine ligase [Croceivirga thetidis]NKI31189.1 phosphoribosylamine--glycine ligase [Croceivirga thetidis]
MNLLIIGSGGREHALAWKLSQSEKLSNLYIAPGNAGTSAHGKNLNIHVSDFENLKSAVLEHNINMVIVGPEVPLVEGIHDYFATQESLKDVSIIGPKKLAATLEGSKDFAKEFMMRHNIPTAKYQSFDANSVDDGMKFLETMESPYVLKADGLAAGKGVLILEDLEEAKNELKSMLLESKFGIASSTVVVEEFLDGIELSCFVLTDGENYKVLPFAKDYKRIGEGDTGLNTGGMGAISPVPFVDSSFKKKIEETIVKPTIEGLKKDNIPYQGFIFIGLIKVGAQPKVIEYNVRMGDPETEVVIPRIKNDLVEILNAVSNKTLNEIELEIDSRTAATVIAVSGGYPESYEKGKQMTGLDQVSESLIFHAGTKIQDGILITNGGRVIAMTSYGQEHSEALQKSYKSLEKISFEAMNYRKDIGFDL